MSPGTKRTIITSKATGRRYFLVRSAGRPSGRRYYVCTNPTCKARVTREADLYCRAHAQQEQPSSDDIADISAKSDQIDENDIQENGEVIDDETPAIIEEKNIEMQSSHHAQQNENGNNGSLNGDDIHESTDEIPANISMPLSPTSQSNRQVEVNELTGARTFRDSSGRRRYLCMQASCKNMLKRQSDLFCHAHMPNGESVNKNKKSRRSRKRYSTPSVSNQSKKNRYRSPFVTPTVTATITKEENGANENQSDEYEIPKKISPQRPGTNRTFRDSSGKLRFLCSIPTCISRVPRQSDYYCKRHKVQVKEPENTQSEITNGSINDETVNDIQEEIAEANEINLSSRQTTSEITPVQSEIKKRKRESSTTDVSSTPTGKIVIATTTLLDDQWSDLLTFLHQFPQAQLSTNLNINNSTTHLLVDDTENLLHCTITKKIVQAAVRRHIFIISSRWLNECMRLNTLVDEHPYEIISDSHTALRSSIQNPNSTNKYLFCSTLQFLYAFSIECRQCQGSINRSELIELIQLTGAQLFESEQAVDILIVLCDSNEKNLTKIKEKYLQAPASNIKYVTSDFLLKSIIKFEIQDIEKYSL